MNTKLSTQCLFHQWLILQGFTVLGAGLAILRSPCEISIVSTISTCLPRFIESFIDDIAFVVFAETTVVESDPVAASLNIF